MALKDWKKVQETGSAIRWNKNPDHFTNVYILIWKGGYSHPPVWHFSESYGAYKNKREATGAATKYMRTH